jgi:hypothetical protein
MLGQNGHLSEPLLLISLALRSVAAAKERFPDYRLTRLVSARLELDEPDVAQLADLFGADVLRPARDALRPFDHHLRYVIVRYGLEALFCDDGYAPYHHAIRPTGYDFFHDEVIPAGMEKWRADYRGMPEERQMLAASIIWLYRAGKDNVWLRRVPCTWHAVDAIARMNATGMLGDWARLYALYSGW